MLESIGQVLINSRYLDGFYLAGQQNVVPRRVSQKTFCHSSLGPEGHYTHIAAIFDCELVCDG